MRESPDEVVSPPRPWFSTMAVVPLLAEPALEARRVATPRMRRVAVALGDAVAESQEDQILSGCRSRQRRGDTKGEQQGG